MAKKTKRKVSVYTPGAPAAEVETPVTTTSSSYRRSSASSAEFNPDYTYIVKDLKRIGVISAVFMVILIVLSFIL